MTWLLMAYLRRRGVDIPAWVSGEGLQLSKLMSPESRIRLSDLQTLWRSAARMAGNEEGLGPRVVMQVDPLSNFSWTMPFSLLEHINYASPNLREALVRQAPFMRLLRDGVSVSIEDWQEDRPLVRWEYANIGAEPRELIDFMMGMGVLLTRRTLGMKSAVPLEVWFTHPAPRDLSAYQALFGTSLRFSADVNGMVVNGPAFIAPLPTYDRTMLEVSEYRARKLLNELPSLDDFGASVRQHIEAELPRGNTTASAVAEKLGISARTLHRRLNAQGTTYQEQLDQVRYRLATRYLASRRYHLGEVAALVGFAQQSAFQRAFKAWAGETPAEYQHRQLSAQLGEHQQLSSRPRARTG